MIFKNNITIKAVEILITVLLLASCNENCKEKKISFAIIDTLPIDKSSISRNWQERERFEILYIGEKKDTIFINQFPYPTPPPPPGVPYDTALFNLRKENTNELSKEIEKFTFKLEYESNIGSIYYDSIRIFVDTSKIIGKNSHPAFPLIIENKFFDSLRVGYSYDRNIYAVLEAKDSVGNWRQITERNHPHGMPTNEEIVLLKNRVIVSSIYSYSGNYKTNFRVKIGTNYSNVYSGKINYNQFNSKFNKYGNYKKEYLNQNEDQNAH